MTDQLRKYLFHDHSARVQTVKLSHAWQTGLAHQAYPDCVRQLLGELVSAAVLLAANIKFEGSLILQLQGDGPIALMVAECSADLSVRATVTLREGRSIPVEGKLQRLMNAQGQGRFIVVLDPDRETSDMKPYQGVVPLEGDTVADVLELYMLRSEQLHTRLWLAANAQQSTGLLIQRLPTQGGKGEPPAEDAESTWERACLLADTLQYDELLSLSTDTLMHRLFWEENLIPFEPQIVRWHCPCTRERVANMLRMLGSDEIESILSEREQIDIACNFCGKPYQFDAVDCAGLFVDQAGAPQTRIDSIH